MKDLHPVVESSLELQTIYLELGPIARATLLEIARRLRLGKERYSGEGEGDFSDARDYGREAKEEFLDGAIYLAVRAVKERT